MQLSNYFEFESAEAKQDFIASARACQPFLKYYIKYLEKKASIADAKITERALMDGVNWEDKLSAYVGERRALEKEIEHLKKYLTFE